MPTPGARGPRKACAGTTMEELERLNKEIESVKTEVEEKQKRLSKFTLTLEELPRSHIASLSDTNLRQDFLEYNSLLPKEKWNEPSKNKESQPRKYVLDHKCPATDLEYDPLLNYSAGLLGTSKARQDETDTQHLCHLKKSVGENCHRSQDSQRPYVSPIRITINLQESDEDDLVMDVPPVMPISKKSKPLRGFKYQNMDKRLHIMSSEERNLQISGTEVEKLEKTQLTTQIDDDGNKLEPPKWLMQGSLDIKSDLNLYGVKNHISKMGSFGGEKNYVCVSEESIPCAPLSDKEIQNRICNESYPQSKKYVKTIYDAQNKESECRYSTQPEISYSDERAEDKVLRRQDKSQDFTTFEDSKLVEFDFDKERTEEDTPSDSDDTMKECLRIFTEFTESKACRETTKQASGKQMEFEMLYYQNTSGPKKRIAHIAKFDVPTSKEIISPLREAVPPLISHPAILRAQQQAVQIMADIKSGQAFLAAPSEQKKIFACPISQIHRKASEENSSNSLHLDVVLSREKPTAKPSRSHIPMKSIASFPIKMPKYKVAHRKRALVMPESSSKVPEEVRQRYVNLFVEKYLRVYKTEDEALNKAKIEEKAIYERCGSRNMYVNTAINTLKKLRHQDVSGSSNSNKTTGLKKNEKRSVLTGIILYRHLKDYLLTEEQLHENNYPQPNPDKPGSIILTSGMTKALVNDTSRKICCRCGKMYGVTPAGKHCRVEECNYHFGPMLSHKVLGGLETRYSCCEGVLGSAGCQVAKLHVHDQKENIEGFVKTFVKCPPADGNPGVFAVNCEVCYTAKGLELTQVTVVDPSLQVVYDTFVKPDEVIDYNTRFSGVVEDDLKNTKTSIRDVQAILLNLFSADTVLIGHSFEHSLYALKLIHTSVVDTTVLFPHRLGLPHKRSLKSLVADHLQRIIQDNGHSSSESAAACMELVLWKVKEDLKGKK
uniref:RNA exonuclease 1 homolog n=1 Tax=Halichoerus grypus TaxID=9711 RepID=UPI0016598C03|nr:RNA exonuclease 1 homolog [Halichoerus grypus]